MKKAASIDEYMVGIPLAQRTALEKLRQQIQRAVPNAEECISYGLPAFRLNGPLVAFGAAKSHCAFYPMSASTIASLKQELKDYDLSKGTIRFQPDNPIPAALVKKIVKARLLEKEERSRTINKTASVR